MSFDLLFLIIICGLVGPFLAGLKRCNIPLVVGEIVAGIIIGKTGFALLNPAEPTLNFLSVIGFAMLMFLVGTHLPLRDPNLRSALGRGLLATGLAFALAVVAGFAVARLTGIAHPAIFVLLFANSSAAVVMPIVHERKLNGEIVLLTTTWVAIADAVTIVALPLAMSGNTLTIAMGAGIVIVASVGCWFLMRSFHVSRIGQYYRGLSKARGWALDLRLSLAVLFGLCALATHFGTSDLVAGFAAGSIVQFTGLPKRFMKQLIGLAEGFFVPLFFVVLGAKLDFTALIHSPTDLELTVLITVFTVIVHVIVCKLVRLPLASGLAACAQLGLPAAVTSLGLTSGLIKPGQGAAIIVAALLSLISCTVGTTLLQKFSTGEPPADSDTGTDSTGLDKSDDSIDKDSD